MLNKQADLSRLAEKGRGPGLIRSGFPPGFQSQRPLGEA
jgi:hypothetical protein